MNDNDKKEFAALLVTAGELYDKTITNALIRLLFDALSRYSIDQVKAAMRVHMLDPDAGRFFPRPADLVRHLEGTSKQREQADADLAELGWQELMAHFRKWGHRQPFFGQNPDELVFKPSDPRSSAALDMIGGYRSLKNINESDLKWKKKEFVEAFGTVGRVDPQRLPAGLSGRDELVALTVQKATTLALTSKGVA